MRLVCPNCAAQYEVDASLLPAEGTEVQCSACSAVWFQAGAAGDKAPPDPVKRPAPASRPTQAPQEPLAENPPTRPARSEANPARQPDTVAPAAVRPAEPRPSSSRPPTPASDEPPLGARPLDPSVAQVLREEAEFEAKQRAKETSPLETQEELGLFGPVGSVDDAPHQRGGASRLPDIEDISSTLEPIDSGRGGQSGLPQTEAARKRSFVAGLILPVGLAGALTALYVAAPMLGQLVPDVDGSLGAYVALVDKARLGVAGLLGMTP